jgi:AraC-like DNA-binding protein/mannose-6-phosphate isomerase-like protein (cupin superfamily)
MITPEETAILEGRNTIDRSLYYRADQTSNKKDEIDASVVLTNGKLIDMRPHTRFIHFPRHTHNYVEFVYMYQGTTTHIIDGNEVVLKEGDLLFMNQHAEQEILPAGEKDIAVNFMIMPQFFDTVLRNLDNESSTLRDFLISCLTDRDMGGNYLYFDAASILPVQNLMENMIWIMLTEPQNRRTLSQTTISLLFLTLIDQASHLYVSGDSYEQNLMLHLLNYIDTEYRTASLTEFAESQCEDIYVLSRFIKKKTGRTFKDLLVEKRLNQAEYLLANTTLPVADIALSVGYENTSYFHRIFREKHGISPRKWRVSNKH